MWASQKKTHHSINFKQNRCELRRAFWLDRLGGQESVIIPRSWSNAMYFYFIFIIFNKLMLIGMFCLQVFQVVYSLIVFLSMKALADTADRYIYSILFLFITLVLLSCLVPFAKKTWRCQATVFTKQIGNKRKKCIIYCKWKKKVLSWTPLSLEHWHTGRSDSS